MSYSASWEVRWWHESLSEETENEEFATREWAYRWLAGFRGNWFRMAEFRRLLASADYRSLERCDDDEVLRLLASEIGSGRFRLVWRKPKQLAGGGGANSDAAPAPAPESAAPRLPAPRLPAPEPVADEPTFPVSADPIAIAETMQEASLFGVPFCEECARKAQANARL